MLKALIGVMLMFFLVGCGSQKDVANLKTSDHLIKKSFMPENELWREDGFAGNGMTEEKFNEIIDSVEKVYVPIIKELGGNLVVERNYSDPTVNAYASRQGDTWTVAMFGGLAKRKEVTEDGFAMVVAHELGHFLAGIPFYSSQDWPASIEGNSDYFATIAAAKTLWKDEDNTTEDINPTAKKYCDEYKAKDLNLCYRTMNASYSLASLLGALNRQAVSFDKLDTTIVKKTKESHPNASCRLTTYIAGALCNVAWDNSVIPQNKKEMALQSCVAAANAKEYSLSFRPRCWYKP